MEQAVNPVEEEVAEDDRGEALDPEGRGADWAEAFELAIGIEGVDAADDERSEDGDGEGEGGDGGEPAGDDLIEGGVDDVEEEFVLSGQLAAFVAEDVLNDAEDEEEEEETNNGLEEGLEHWDLRFEI
jgi:hypothetical protein